MARIIYSWPALYGDYISEFFLHPPEGITNKLTSGCGINIAAVKVIRFRQVAVKTYFFFTCGLLTVTSNHVRV